MTMFQRDKRPPPPIIRERREPPPVVQLARAASPTESERALAEVVHSLTSEARSAIKGAKVELELLDADLETYQNHLFHVINDCSERVATVKAMGERHTAQTRIARRAVFSAPLYPPRPPADLADDHVVADTHEETSPEDTP